MTHPIEQTLRRGRGRTHEGCHLGLAIHAVRDPRWVPAAALTDAPRRMLTILDIVGLEVGSERRDVQASLFLESYAWRLVLPLAGALVAERRVLAPTVREVLLRPTDGRPGELRLTPGSFTILPDDRAANHHAAKVVQGTAALARAFEDALLAHFALIVEVLNAVSGRARRALWRTIGDRTATALLYAGLAVDDRQAGERAAQHVLRQSSLLQVTAAYTTISRADGPKHVHLRHGCCLWWRSAAASRCATCPLERRRSAPPV
jgi:ferric iron reductase protein FhuF